MNIFDGEIRTGIAADPSGIAPKSDLVQGSAEYQRYEQVRREFDRPLQVVGVVPMYPQTDVRDTADYRRQLLQTIAPHTAEYARTPCRFLSDEKLKELEPKIVADAMNKPYREGKMAEIKIIDQSGRTISEFIGPKNSWLNAFKAPVAATGIVIDGVPRRVG